MSVTHLPAPANSDVSLAGIRALNRVGGTEHFEVFYDRSLGETGRSAGAVVLNRAERDLATIREWFGDSVPLPDHFTVVLARLPDDSRASRALDDHGQPTILLCDVQTTPQLEALQSSFFLTVLLAELLAVAAGWETAMAGALARVLATALYPRRILGFATGWVWLESKRDDFSAIQLPLTPGATGYAVLFLNYLHHQLGFPWYEIATTVSPTLGAVAERLTGSSGEVASFRSLLAEHLPVGAPSALRTDNPFPLDDEPAQPLPAPVPVRTATSTGGVHRRVCLLTGSSGRLGAYLCQHHTDQYDFAAVYRRNLPSGEVYGIKADLTGDGECDRVVEVALDRFGRVDLVVNAAVASIWGSMLECEPIWADAPVQFVTNVVVPLRLSCAIARLSWRLEVDENRAGNRNVVNVSSVSGRSIYPGEGQSVYAASKAALDHLTGHMALEFASIGVRVNAVAPNSFPSNIPIKRVAQAIVGLDEGNANGSIVVVDGVADRHLQLVPALVKPSD